MEKIEKILFLVFAVVVISGLGYISLNTNHEVCLILDKIEEIENEMIFIKKYSDKKTETPCYEFDFLNKYNRYSSEKN
jgi:hypothetical protein